MEMGQPAFLLAQIGAHAASQFAERLTVLSLTPPEAGILRILRACPGLSQQELAGLLKIHPSRLVAILDSLEQRRLVVRKPNSDDRRLYSLHLTSDGTGVLGQIGDVAKKHQETLLAALRRARPTCSFTHAHCRRTGSYARRSSRVPADMMARPPAAGPRPRGHSTETQGRLHACRAMAWSTISPIIWV
jgi:DNA-binding MarR family transcriptional regulator